jgi:hypothetical protein
MVDFLTLTANSNVSRLDIFDSSDFFDFQADVARPEVLRPRRRRDPRLVDDDWKVKWGVMILHCSLNLDRFSSIKIGKRGCELALAPALHGRNQ